MTKTYSTVIGHEGHFLDVELRAPDDTPEFWGANRDFAVIGEKNIPRLDALEKVTGKAKFTYDIVRPNMLHAAMVTSPYANARVTNIDTSEAEAMPGVKSVIALRVRSVQYAGALLAGVAAETIQQAREAARKVKVEYETRSFKSEMSLAPSRKEALSRSDSGETEYREGRVVFTNPKNRGNIIAGLKQAGVVHEATYETQVTPHCPLEAHGCVAEWEGDNLTVWYSVQGIWAARQSCASAARISQNQVRVITQHMGGGFGSKLQTEDFGNLCIEMARTTGRPVKFMADRYEDIVMCGNKPGSSIQVQIAGTAEGKLTSISATARSIVGYSGSQGFSAPFHAFYDCPNVHYSGSAVRLNAGLSRPFRAPGWPQGAFALEMAIDELAWKLDMDPFELRMNNISSSELDARVLELRTGAERFGWADKYKKPGTDTGPIKRGVGCAMTAWNYNAGSATVRCSIFPDGSVEIANGCQDLGTGLRTAMANAAAEMLGCEPAQIRVVTGDTGLGLPGPQSGGSVTTAGVAPAVHGAAYKALNQLFELVASSWNTTAEELDCLGGMIFMKNDTSQSMPWQEATALIPDDAIVTTAQGRSAGVARGVRSGSMMRGAQFAEVEADTQTGKVRCLQIVAVQDCGKAMAKKQAENQINGGVVMGISYALLEDRILDNMTGRQINPNMETYKILGPVETPEIIPILIDVYDPANTSSAKGIGEPPHIPTAAAIGCAVANALGVPVRSLPITPYKVLAALEGREG